jgi:hypothetical protein
MYRLFIASFDPKLSNKVICDVGNEAQRRFRVLLARCVRAQKMIALCRDAGATIASEVLDTGHAGVSNVRIADNPRMGSQINAFPTV